MEERRRRAVWHSGAPDERGFLDEILRIHEYLAIPMAEIEFRFSRSGGPGGQHVNRTASQVELRFDVASSNSLTDAQKARISTALRGHIDSQGILHLTSQATPSQWRNRQDVLDRLGTLLAQALRPRRKRVPTRPTRASQERRLERKQHRGRKKALRRPVRRMDE